ncbi:MAG: hypothetical protein GXY67_07825 [Clostridiales bacterium]|nr:hypothetical protein [Clostridiales bacterium]
MIQNTDYVAAGKALLAEVERRARSTRAPWEIPYVPNGMTLDGMDCQGLIEYLAMQCGMTKAQVNLAGSNAHWRMTCKWRGTVAECVKAFGSVPPGAWLFIHTDGYNSKYKDNDGDASHVGAFLDGTTAVHASSSQGKVAASTFKGKAINGGWNCVGLSKWINFGAAIEQKIAALQGGTAGQAAEVSIQMALYDARVVTQNGKGCYLRALPDGESKTLATVPYGATVQVLEVSGDRSRVFWGGVNGWMPSQFLQQIGGAVDLNEASQVPSLTGGYGVWIPCSSVENAKALVNLLNSAGVKSL